MALPIPLNIVAGETNGARIARFLTRLLAPGPLGQNERRDDYRLLVSCGLDEDGGAKLSTIKTSCAIFARAVYHWCGRPARHPWRVGWPMFGGWLGDLSFKHSAWRPYKPGDTPEPGDLFYVQHPVNPNNNHVGFFLKLDTGPTWRTAEGGGGDGTQCRLSTRSLGSFFDRSRRLMGWWSAEALVLTAPPELPTPGSETPTIPPPATLPTLRLGSKGADVVRLQQLLAVQPADGVFGPQTEQVVKTWQTRNGLEADGVVGSKTWAAIIKTL